ncbi:hypothetical protein GYB22_07845 [bacterium]|nr:hypothetical protein [bacterium]
MNIKLLTIPLCLLGMYGFGQDVEAKIDRLIESRTEYIEQEQIDPYLMRNTLEDFLSTPLDINTADTEELKEALFLSSIQQQEIIQHRNKFGAFLDLAELLLLAHFNAAIIHDIAPFITIRPKIPKGFKYDFQVNQEHQVRLNFRTDLPLAEGYKRDYNGYLSNAFYTQFVYRGHYRNKLKWGVSMEKDAGEPLIYPKSNTPDYYSFYLQFQNIGRLEQAVIGDFQINLGQGLNISNGYGPSKAGWVSSIKSSSRGVSSFRSFRENAYLRGIAGQYRIRKYSVLGGFLSQRKLDAYLRTDSTGEGFTRSLSEDGGLHRTEFESSLRDQVQDIIYGGFWEQEMKIGSVGLVSYYRGLSDPLMSSGEAYTARYFEGKHYVKSGLYYDIHWSSVNLFGEYSYQNKKLGAINGCLISTGKTDLGLLVRVYPPGSIPFLSSAMSEGSTSRNESGIYMGLDHQISSKLKISFHQDHYSFPWLRFKVYNLSFGKDSWLELSYRLRKRFKATIRFKEERKEQAFEDEYFETLDFRLRRSLRWHTAWTLSKQAEIRLRYEISQVRSNEQYWGEYIYLEAILSSSNMNWKFSGRVSSGNIDHYDSRIYSYEQAPQGIYPLHNQYFTGQRYYIYLRRSFSRFQFQIKVAMDHHLEPRIAIYQSYSTGSYLEERDGLNKYTFVFQIKYKK